MEQLFTKSDPGKRWHYTGGAKEGSGKWDKRECPCGGQGASQSVGIAGGRPEPGRVNSAPDGFPKEVASGRGLRRTALRVNVHPFPTHTTTFARGYFQNTFQALLLSEPSS